jgi:hypothetical protein
LADAATPVKKSDNNSMIINQNTPYNGVIYANTAAIQPLTVVAAATIFVPTLRKLSIVL